MKGYIGIDPGITKTSPGCAALLTCRGGWFICDWKDEQTAKRVVSRWRNQYEVKAALERIPTMSRPGLFPSMKLAINFGFWIGILTALDIEFKVIEARTWQAHMLMKGAGRDTKERSLYTAREIISGTEKVLKFKTRHSGRADALLIARHLKNEVEFLDRAIGRA